MNLFVTMLLVLMTLPCSADETAINKAVAKRVYEEGLSRGIFTVPYGDRPEGAGERHGDLPLRGREDRRGVDLGQYARPDEAAWAAVS